MRGCSVFCSTGVRHFFSFCSVTSSVIFFTACYANKKSVPLHGVCSRTIIPSVGIDTVYKSRQSSPAAVFRMQQINNGTATRQQRTGNDTETNRQRRGNDKATNMQHVAALLHVCCRSVACAQNSELRLRGIVSGVGMGRLGLEWVGNPFLTPEFPSSQAELSRSLPDRPSPLGSRWSGWFGS